MGALVVEGKQNNSSVLINRKGDGPKCFNSINRIVLVVTISTLFVFVFISIALDQLNSTSLQVYGTGNGWRRNLPNGQTLVYRNVDLQSADSQPVFPHVDSQNVQQQTVDSARADPQNSGSQNIEIMGKAQNQPIVDRQGLPKASQRPLDRYTQQRPVSAGALGGQPTQKVSELNSSAESKDQQRRFKQQSGDMPKVRKDGAYGDDEQLRVDRSFGAAVDLGVSFRVPTQQITGSGNIKRMECPEQGDAAEPVDIGVPNMKAVFIVGAMKSGTTLVYRALSKHTQYIGMRCTAESYKRTWGLKETHFLSRSSMPQKGFSAYMRKWKESINNSTFVQQENMDNPIIVDGTPDYMIYPYVAPRLKRLFPGSKIIIILRDPVDRLVSQYTQWIDQLVASNTYDPENPPETLYKTMLYEWDFIKQRKCFFGLEENMDNINTTIYSFDDYCTSKLLVQNEKSATEWSQCLGCLQGNMWSPVKSCYGEELQGSLPEGLVCKLGYFILRGLYAPQIANYLNFYSQDDMMILNLESLQEDLVGSLNKIAAFTGHVQNYTAEDVKRNDLGEQHLAKSKQILEKSKQDIEDSVELATKMYRKPNQELYKLLNYIGVVDFNKFKSDKKPNKLN